MNQISSTRYHCDEILKIIPIYDRGLRAPLQSISKEMLNHVFSPHKMTIGQIAIHCTAWAKYFLTNPKPWKVVPWTCKPCTYPLTIKFVNEVIDEGIGVMVNTLKKLNDDLLEIKENGEKGPGYIICRLLLHILSHSNQMAYLRQLLDPKWDFGSHFGDMATAYINLDYSTSRDFSVLGF